jgi:Ku protein
MRPIWSGTISFGLVSVPVRMFPATESKELRFHFLDRKDLTPIAYEKVRRDDRRPVEADEIVRGFEIEKGRYVPLDDEDLDRLDIELTHSIDIMDFAISTRSTRSTSARRTTSCRRRERRSPIACSSVRSRRPARSGSRRS